MYPEVRAAVGAGAGPDLSAPGFDLVAHREEVRLFNLRQPREDVASVEDVEVDGVRCRLYTPADPLDGLVVHAHGDMPVDLARRLGGEVTPARLAAAQRSGEHDPQAVTWLWHCLARFGRSAPATG